MNKKIVDTHHPDDFQHDSPLKIRRVLVVGASSYIGSALCLGLRDTYEVFGSIYKSPMSLEGVHFVEMDCLNASDILSSVQRYRPDFVIYCAGLSNIKLCENNPLLSEAINTRALTLFFKVLPRPVPFLYFSCDQIFSGSSHDLNFRFDEQDDANPVNQWGHTKAQGEALVLAHNRLTYVLRLARLYGEVLGSPQHTRSTWVQNYLEAAHSNAGLSLPSDQWRSTLYIGDLVRAVRMFIQHAPLSSTVYNLSASDALTPQEMAAEVFKAWSLDETRIHKTSLDTYLADEKHKEPHFSALTGRLFEKDFDWKFQSLKEGLQEMRERLKKGHIKNWA
jgi:dTDP-4-dehydrorhamnose reductase